MPVAGVNIIENLCTRDFQIVVGRRVSLGLMENALRDRRQVSVQTASPRGSCPEGMLSDIQALAGYADCPRAAGPAHPTRVPCFTAAPNR